MLQLFYKRLARIKPKNKQLTTAIVFIVLFAAIGTYLLIGSHAATPYTSITATAGSSTGTGSYSIGSDTNTSSGKYIQFGTSGSSTGGGGGYQTLNCFNANSDGSDPKPSVCGLPDPNSTWTATTGVGPNNGSTSVACSALATQHTGDVSTSTSISNENIMGSLTVTGNNVTINNVCVNDPTTDLNEAGALVLSGSGDEVDNSTIEGSAANNGTQATGGVQNGVNGSGTLNHDFIQHCDTCIHSGPWTVENTYVMQDSDLSVLGQEAYGHCDEDEDVYTSDVQMTFSHDVLLASPQQTCLTAVIFGDTGGGSGGSCDNKWTVTNSLLAGENYITEPCANASGAGTSSIDFSNDNIARCGSSSCSPNSHGYFQDGGYYDTQAHNYCSSETWSNVVWDDTGATISC